MTKKPTQSQILVRYAEQAAEMFHTPDGRAHVTVETDGRVETWPVNGRQFVQFLRWSFYSEHGGAPSEQALAEARATVAAKAVFDGPKREVFIRVGKYEEDTVYLDLGNERREIVEITALGWSVLSSKVVPVRFVRKENAAELPRPMSGGSIEDLRSFINVRTDEDFVLILSWLVGALNPDGPYPILIIQGEQGSAKSTTVRVVRSMVDPAVEPLRAPPRDERDLAIAASNGWALALDNLSGVKHWLSDALCRVATGGGIATRELYSDDRETIFRVKRPIVLNGIDSMSNAGDLRDRSVIVELPPIPQERKRTEREFYREFETVRPLMLGALLDSVSAALGNLNEVRLEEVPRMADFAAWVTAAEEALPWKPGSFLGAYTSNRAEANALSVGADPLAAAVQKLMLGREEWTGTATELYTALCQVVDEDARRSRAWPGAPNSLSDKMKRIAPALREAGIQYEDERLPGGSRTRQKSLKKLATKDRPDRPGENESLATSEHNYRNTTGSAGRDRDDRDGRDDGQRPSSGRERFVI